MKFQSFHYFRIPTTLLCVCCIALEVKQYEDDVLCADPTHLEAGKEHLRNKRAREKLICKHCHRCAFCRPVYDMCWSGEKPGEHLPPKHWEQVMDEIIKETTVMEVIVSKVPKGSLNKKRIMREAYRRNFCVSVPTSIAMDIIPPTAKRQRHWTKKDLSRDAYMEKTSTDSFSGEDRTRLLLIYNKLSFLPAQQKCKDPLSMSDVRYPKNVYVRKQVRWYCQDVLEIIVSPGHGSELYGYINDLEIQYVNRNIQNSLNIFVDNMIQLFVYGKH